MTIWLVISALGIALGALAIYEKYSAHRPDWQMAIYLILLGVFMIAVGLYGI